MENEGTELNEFRDALFGDDGYHTETDEAGETGSEETPEANDDTDGGEPSQASGEEPNPEGEDKGNDKGGAEGSQKPDSEPAQTYTLKVNKEERNVSLEEMTALAQKGADYDRVKGQIVERENTISDLQGKLDKQQAILDVLQMIAGKDGGDLSQLTENLYVNFRKSQGGSEDAARAELKNASLEKELAATKAKQAEEQKQESEDQNRAQREVEEFRKEYPDVELTDELVDKLLPDVQGGMPLSAAYRKMERSQQAEKIAELERKLAAEQKNAKNRRSSPGSQQDSGGKATHSEIDSFRRALFG